MAALGAASVKAVANDAVLGAEILRLNLVHASEVHNVLVHRRGDGMAVGCQSTGVRIRGEPEGDEAVHRACAGRPGPFNMRTRRARGPGRGENQRVPRTEKVKLCPCARLPELGHVRAPAEGLRVRGPQLVERHDGLHLLREEAENVLRGASGVLQPPAFEGRADEIEAKHVGLDGG